MLQLPRTDPEVLRDVVGVTGEIEILLHHVFAVLAYRPLLRPFEPSTAAALSDTAATTGVRLVQRVSAGGTQHREMPVGVRAERLRLRLVVRGSRCVFGGRHRQHRVCPQLRRRGHRIRSCGHLIRLGRPARGHGIFAAERDHGLAPSPIASGAARLGGDLALHLLMRHGFDPQLRRALQRFFRLDCSRQLGRCCCAATGTSARSWWRAR